MAAKKLIDGTDTERNRKCSFYFFTSVARRQETVNRSTPARGGDWAGGQNSFSEQKSGYCARRFSNWPLRHYHQRSC